MTVRVVAAALMRPGVDGAVVLAARRRRPPGLAGGWEFPGGKVEPGESDVAALARECHEELGVQVTVGPRLGVATDGPIELALYTASCAGEPRAGDDHDDLRWLAAAALGAVHWLPIDAVLLPDVAAALRAGNRPGTVSRTGNDENRRDAVEGGGRHVETVSFDSHGTRCEAWYLRAVNDEWTTTRGRPCVVMAHGFGATRDAGLLPFAERFAASGADVLVFDYRGFGTSDGEPRQDVHHRRHREDYHAAIAWARARRGVDPSRIAVWGSSYSGGHVIAVAAKDQRVAAVISQGAAMDGLAALFGVQGTSGSGKVASLTRDGVRDTVRMLRRQDPLMVPVVGEPGSTAVISAPGADVGYRTIMGPTFRNEMCARGILRIARNRPVRLAARVTCPALIVVAEHDNIAPVKSVYRTAERIRRAEVVSFPVGHFDIYTGETFEKSVVEQVDFLQRTIGG